MSNPTTAATAGTAELRWRLGNRNPRNLYLGETHVGMLIEPELAAQIVAVMNAARDRADLAEMVRVLVEEQLPTEPNTLADLLGRVLDGTYDPREAA